MGHFGRFDNARSNDPGGHGVDSAVLLVLYVFGAFIVYAGIHMLFIKKEAVHPEESFIFALPTSTCVLRATIRANISCSQQGQNLRHAPISGAASR